jgi:hypothetical protein
MLVPSRVVAGLVAVVAAMYIQVEPGQLRIETAPASADHAPSEGFGADTRGGDGQPVYRVTSLADSGPGTLRDAVSRGNRHVVFDVSGTIRLSDRIEVRGANITIDGFTAPKPGITITGSGLRLRGALGAHHVIVRGIRVRGAHSKDSVDCITVTDSASNVLIEHVSTADCADGSIDVGHGARDVTVAWSILHNPQKTSLVAYGGHRITMHHNLIIAGSTRNPYVTCGSNDPSGRNVCHAGKATDTTMDFRNNLLWAWGDHGIRVRHGAWANVVDNLLSSPGASSTVKKRGIIVCRGDGVETPETLGRCDNGDPSNGAYGYAAGNVSLDGVDLSQAGNVKSPFPAPPVTTTSACVAAHAVASSAGVRPLDATDAAFVGALALPSCPDGPTGEPASSSPEPALPDLKPVALSAPSSATAGQSVSVTTSIMNAGTATAPGSTAVIVLSTDGAVDGGDPVLASISVPSLPAGTSHTATVTVTVPSGTAAGSYQVLVKADAPEAIAESSETNNVLGSAITISTASTGSGKADLVGTSISMPSTLYRGVKFNVTYTITNQGGTTAPASRTHFYLSKDTTYSKDDIYVRVRDVPSLKPGASYKDSKNILVDGHETVKPGSYYMLWIVDSRNDVDESNEDNNVRALPVVVK